MEQNVLEKKKSFFFFFIFFKKLSFINFHIY